jgi:uncharacterized protein (TIGR04255 family)
MKKLPTKLLNQPLIDAVFEVRFTSSFPAANLFPGLFHGQIEGEKSIESLPLAQLPKEVRDADPNLAFSPVIRINLEKFYVNIGDRSLSVGIKTPYPGWSEFKEKIIQIVEIAQKSGIIDSVERYSLKYIDLIAAGSVGEQIQFINSDISIAGHKLINEDFQIRIQIPNNDFINALQVISSATVVLNNGDKKEGLVIDIDTIANQNSISLNDFISDCRTKLDLIHRINKELFFDCLTQEAINALGPVYE